VSRHICLRCIGEDPYSCKEYVIEYKGGITSKPILYEDSDFEHCINCGVGQGGYHHLYCESEKCPCCGGQLISCEYPLSYERNTRDQQDT
jgi:hypothetical protein